MLKEILKEKKFFLDIPEEIATTGSKPGRGIYSRLTYAANKHVWLDSKGRVIDNENWIAHLNQLAIKF
jgi:hypothetical protein